MFDPPYKKVYITAIYFNFSDRLLIPRIVWGQVYFYNCIFFIYNSTCIQSVPFNSQNYFSRHAAYYISVHILSIRTGPNYFQIVWWKFVQRCTFGWFKEKKKENLNLLYKCLIGGKKNNEDFFLVNNIA